jgi:hypothetical protein
MDPVTIGLIATSALGKLGSIFGQQKRKQIDPNMLKQMFGAKAITDEQMDLFKRALNSSQGQQLMTNAAQTGQQFQTDVAKGAAEAGLGPAGGASGGADIFAGASGASATNNLQRGVQANLMEAMLPIAQNLVRDRMDAWLGDREKVLGQTTRFQDIMGAVGGLSSDLLASKQASQAGDAGKGTQASSAAMPAGATGAAPDRTGVAGTQPVVGPPSRVAMPSSLAQSNMPGMRDDQMRMMLSGGGGRFARAMSARNRFGAVQPAF